MQMRWYQFAVLVVAVAGLVGAGCYRASGDGDGNGSRYDGGLDGQTGECASDTDCSGDEVCTASGQCLVNCTESTSACTDTEFCREVPSGKKGCYPNGSADIGVDGDDGSSDTGGGGGDGSPFFVQIKDLTRSESPDGDTVCDAGDAGDIDAAGSDIGGVVLLDDQGQALAWGTDDIANNFTNSRVNQQPQTVLDGRQPTLATAPEAGVECPSSDGTSPEFSNSTVVSLGCKGSVLIGFRDDNGDWIPIREGYQIVVYEYGKECFSCYPDCPDGPGFGREAVFVRTCEPTDDPEAQLSEFQAASFDGNGNLAACSNAIGGDTGTVVGPLEVSF